MKNITAKWERDDADGEELGDDSDSDIDDCAVPDGYNHDWLPEFDSVGSPVDVTDDISVANLFRLFITDEVIRLTETNKYAAEIAEMRGGDATAYSRVNLGKEVSFEEMNLKAFGYSSADGRFSAVIL